MRIGVRRGFGMPVTLSRGAGGSGGAKVGTLPSGGGT